MNWKERYRIFLSLMKRNSSNLIQVAGILIGTGAGLAGYRLQSEADLEVEIWKEKMQQCHNLGGSMGEILGYLDTHNITREKFEREDVPIKNFFLFYHTQLILLTDDQAKYLTEFKENLENYMEKYGDVDIVTLSQLSKKFLGECNGLSKKYSIKK